MLYIYNMKTRFCAMSESETTGLKLRSDKGRKPEGEARAGESL